MDAGTATIVASSVTALGAIIVAYMNKVHRDNRKDHAFVVDRLEVVHTDLKEIKTDVQDVKVDVSALKAHQENIKERLHHLERDH